MGTQTFDALAEFDRQVNRLVDLNYPELAAGGPARFLETILPLRRFLQLERSWAPLDLEQGKLPFVIVVRSAFLATEQAMTLVEREGKTAVVKMHPYRPHDFETITEEVIPEGLAYLLIDVDRGKDNINQPPCDAMKVIRSAGRFPLTVEEGVAIVTHHSDFLMKNNCFSLLASRRPGDKRVPAIWINGEKRPNLGWCWDGNPHTWLGSASCGSRLGE